MLPAKRSSAARGAEVDDGGAGDAKRPKKGGPEDTSSGHRNLVNEPDDEAGPVGNHIYGRSHERYTWRGVLHSHADPKKRFKLIPRPRSRKGVDVDGSCNWFAVTTSLQAAYRISGIEVGELSWEELYELVGPNIPHRTTASLRVLKYKGIRTTSDYSQGRMDGKRYKISQYHEFFNPDLWERMNCVLDRENMKAAIDNMLSKSVMLCSFPISENYQDYMENRSEHIYEYDPACPLTVDGSPRVRSHLVVVTGFGFEENIPYFEFQDSNGENSGKKGYGRILPTSISMMYGFDIIQD